MMPQPSVARSQGRKLGCGVCVRGMVYFHTLTHTPSQSQRHSICELWEYVEEGGWRFPRVGYDTLWSSMTWHVLFLPSLCDCSGVMAQYWPNAEGKMGNENIYIVLCKLLWCKRNKMLGCMLLKENNELQGGDSNPELFHHPFILFPFPECFIPPTHPGVSLSVYLLLPVYLETTTYLISIFFVSFVSRNIIIYRVWQDLTLLYCAFY